jgi:hypothetical protein
MARQQLLTRPDAPQVRAVLDEAALRRPIGGAEVMRAQLQALIDISKLDNVTVQVTLFSSGGHAAEGGAFTILRFPEPDLSDVVYLEHVTSAMYLDRRSDVDTYLETMDRLSIESETPEATVRILAQMQDEL